MLDAEGVETGMFEIPAGGRRFQALSLLVKQKRLAKAAPIPCIVRDAASHILAEDDSLAENMQRVALHPLDQFRAFQALREKGQGDKGRLPQPIRSSAGEISRLKGLDRDIPVTKVWSLGRPGQNKGDSKASPPENHCARVRT